MKPPSKLVRGLTIGRLTLCFPLESHPKYGRIWVCKCSCGRYTKRISTVLLHALADKRESMCRTCQREIAKTWGRNMCARLETYGMRGYAMRHSLRGVWKKHKSLYTANSCIREEDTLMRVFVENFGPIREWELGNKNFSLDETFEEERRVPMIVKYCDICGSRLGGEVPTKNYLEETTRSLIFPKTDKRESVEVEVKLLVNAYCVPCDTICEECVKRVVSEGRVLP